MSNVRVLKLQPEYRRGKYDRNSHVVPTLKLSGNWLRDAGFLPGKIIHVHVENNVLIVQAIES